MAKEYSRTQRIGDQMQRELASVRAAMVLLDTATYDDIKARLEPLAAADRAGPVLAAAHLPVFVLVRHVRINQFHERYFSLVYVFGTLAGLLTLAGLAASRPALLSSRQAAEP